jgi:hypothetical protein
MGLDDDLVAKVMASKMFLEEKQSGNLDELC